MLNFTSRFASGSLVKMLSEYFRNDSQKTLETELFPDNPEMFTAIAWQRKIGIPRSYLEVATSKPVRAKQVFFESNLGKQYTGNPRYIYEEMLGRFPDFEYVWCYSGDKDIPGNPKIVNRGTAEYYKNLATSGLVINNTTFPIWFLRNDTFYLQTWHGTPLKKLHWDVSVRRSNTTPAFFAKSTGWNALLSPNHYSTLKFSSCFRFGGDILETGYPANDIFSQPDRYARVREEIRSKLGANEDQKLVLYAPTWRDGTHLGNFMFKFDLMLDLDTALENTPENYIYLIRAHHMSEASQLEDSLTEAQRKRVIDVSGWDDAIELMCAADILITDYSSIVYDWACSKKPMVYYVPDFEEYETKLRGMYYDMNALNAGPITSDMKQLCKALTDDLQHNCIDQEFWNMFCSINDGNATSRVINFLEKKEILPPSL